MNSIEDFLQMIRDHLGLPVTAQDATSNFDDVPGWDSVHLLWLLSSLEERTGRQLSLPDALQAASLEEIYLLAVR